MLKRTLTPESTDIVVKKSRVENEESLVISNETSNSLIVSDTTKSKYENGRRSGLQSVNMSLTGHEGTVFSIAFDSTGKSLCSGSMDSKIFLWDVYGSCKNYNVLTGHKSAILEVKWLHNLPSILSASADKTVCLWDANKGTKLRKYSLHTGVVNTCSVARDNPKVFVSGSDDCTAVVWDTRNKRAVQSLYHDYQVTSSSVSHDGNYVFTGGIDNIIRRFDLRKGTNEADMALYGHTDTITGLSLSPCGNFILSNSMEGSVAKWDVKPFVIDENNRLVSVYKGATHGAEKNLLRCAWSPDQSFVTSGSADRMVHIWDANTTKLLYFLPGHKGSVNDVIFHPNEPIIASCSTDKQIFLGELGSLF